MVSLYFDSSQEGVTAYRKTAQKIQEETQRRGGREDEVEMKYTPQLGQMRISFEFEKFFEWVNEMETSLLTSFVSPSLPSSSSSSPSS